MAKITKSNDALGMAVMAYYKGEVVTEIIERSDFLIYSSTNGLVTYFNQYKDWRVSDKKAIAYIKGKTLDIGCGAGRVSLYLQKKNIPCLAIDNSPLAIRVCKLRGVKRAKVLAIENLNKLKENNFKAITLLGNNFGLLGTPTKAKKILKQLHHMTTSDARIVAQTFNVYASTNPIHLAYQRNLKKRGRLTGESTIRCRYANIIGPWFDYMRVSPSEMYKILEETGWKIKNLIEEPNSPIYCAIIEKE